MKGQMPVDIEIEEIAKEIAKLKKLEDALKEKRKKLEEMFIEKVESLKPIDRDTLHIGSYNGFDVKVVWRDRYKITQRDAKIIALRYPEFA